MGDEERSEGPARPEDRSEGTADPASGDRSRWRWPELLSLLGLTGFAIAQPLLSIAGENPSMFAFAGVRGAGLVAFALLVAVLPALVGWAVVVAVGAVRRRAGDVTFLVFAGLLAGLAVVQPIRAAGVDQRWLALAIVVLAGAGFATALARWQPVATWTRYTSVLPAIAVVMLLVASPSGDLVTSPSGSVASRAEGDEPSIVFLMFDEFPLMSILGEDGEIDPVRFPNLAALAATSTWYPRYTVLSNATLHSVPSILSGRPPSGGPALWTNHPDNLFSLFAPTHELDVSETVTQLCGYSNCGIDGADSARKGLPHVMSQMADVWQQRVGLRESRSPDLGQFFEEAEELDPETDVAEKDWDEQVAVTARPARATDFIESLRRTSGPTLSYLHLMLPHQPWAHAPDGRPFYGLSPQNLLQLVDEPEEWDMAVMEQSHLLQAQYADRLVGEVLEALHDAGTYDDTMVVVTADHGIAFDRGSFPNLRNLRDDSISAVAYVPLLIKEPGQVDGRVDESNLDALDVLPTVADVLDVDLPWDLEGAAAGSEEVRARDDRKELYPLDDDLETTAGDVFEFQADEHQPDPASRRIGPIDEGEDHLAALFRYQGIDEWIGAAVDDLDPTPGRGVRFYGAAHLASDSSTGAKTGVGSGEVFDSTDEGTVLLAVDGVVVSAAPLRDDGQFVMLVSPDTPRGSGREVQVLLVVDDEVEELRPS